MKSIKTWLFATVLALALTIPALAVDSDNDGLDDLVESNSGVYIDQFDTGTDPINPDTDGDGVSDGHEVNYGSHPLNFYVVPSSWKIGSDVRITNNDAIGSVSASLVWTGTEYGVSWQDERDGNWEIYFTLIDALGNKTGSDIRITNDIAYAQGPTLVWTGSEYGVSWIDNRDGHYEIYFARIDASGNKLGSDTRITNDTTVSVSQHLVWTGSEFGVAFRDERNGVTNTEIYFARIDGSGNKIGADVRITNAPGRSDGPSLIWTGTEYGVSWYDERNGVTNNEIYFARTDASGNKIGADVRITNYVGSSYEPSLIWTGTEYGVSWHDTRDGNQEIYFARIDASGNKIGADVRITNAPGSSFASNLVWTGKDYSVSWMDNRDGDTSNYEIYFTRIDASGNKIGAGIRITNDIRQSGRPSPVWTGTEYGMSWYDYRDGNVEIYFARIAVDEDGDGLPNSYDLSIGTDVSNWDSDGDYISDLHEDWSDTDPLSWDPAGKPSLFCYGDQDGDGVASLSDVNSTRDEALLKPADCSQVYPQNCETLDLDASDDITLPDVNIIRDWSLIKANPAANPGLPVTINILSPSEGYILPLGETVEVVVEVRSPNGKVRPGMGVVFELLSGTATIFGGRGNAALEVDPDTGTYYTAGSRWSVTGAKADGATAKIVIRRDAAGVIQLQARIPKSPNKQVPSSISATLTLN